MIPATDVAWELDYDASWFIALPSATEIARDAMVLDGWMQGCLERFAAQPGVGADELAVLRSTADALAAQIRPDQTQLWFAPRGLYSDLLVSIAVAPVGAVGATTDDLFEGASFATAVDVTPLRTATHGGGYLFRRNEVVPAEPPILVEQWTVRLNDGMWSILIDTLGSTLPAFVLFEEQLLRLISGIILPGSAADRAHGAD